MKNGKILILLTIFLFLSVFLNFYLLKNTNKNAIENKEKNTTLSKIDNLLTDSDDENIFEKINNNFKNINNLESFKIFNKDFNGINYLILLSKLKDKEGIERYISFLLEDNNLTDEELKSKLNNFFEKIYSWSEIVPIESDWDFDLPYFFNTLPIEQSDSVCTKLGQVDQYFSDKQSCFDKIFLYRATSENNYCEKISDPYRVRLCNDFLKYTNQ